MYKLQCRNESRFELELISINKAKCKPEQTTS